MRWRTTARKQIGSVKTKIRSSLAGEPKLDAPSYREAACRATARSMRSRIETSRRATDTSAKRDLQEIELSLHEGGFEPIEFLWRWREPPLGQRSPSAAGCGLRP